MSFSFTGKKALVTGAGRGIGKDIAISLAEAGAEVYALSRNPDNLKAIQKECPKLKIIACDLSNWKETEKALADLPAVDFLVNNAGVAMNRKYSEVTEEDVDWLFDVNFKAVVNVTKIVTNKMIASKKKGSIVNVSSTAAFLPGEDLMFYHCTKAAVDMLTRSTARVFGPHGIRVNSIAPTVTPTDMVEGLFSKEDQDIFKKTLPLRELPSTKDTTNATLFLLSDLSAFTTGSCVPVDSGELLVGDLSAVQQN